VQASNSGGLALKNSGGTTQMLLGGGGGDNITLSVATNITPANAAVAISPTGTGTVTLNPATASTINNMSIGATTALAGRFTDVTLTTGNLVIGTSGKGIDFTATPGTGTSELLADYEEGTWTPTDASGAGLVLTVANASYTKVGRLVEASFAITFPVTVSVAAIRLGGLPFTSQAFGTSMNTVSFSVVQYAAPITGNVDANATTFIPLTYGAGTITNASMSGLILRGTAIYEV
jgi:hypothetical protein